MSDDSTTGKDADVEAIKALQERYVKAAHAMQTGVAFHQQHEPDNGSPKHLRVGVNSAMVQNGALVTLLIAKGVFTEREWWEALASAMEREAQDYAALLSRLTGGAHIRLL